MNQAEVQPIYQIDVTDINGKKVGMDQFRDKVILIVNTASKCGFTPQYEGLETLYKKYEDRDFVILGFPCNQFGGQEPDDEETIKSECLLNYGVTFPMFSKVLVNGKDAHPLFQYLKSELTGLLGGRIKWNFTKFLIDRDGTPIKRFAPTDTPKSLEKDIERLL